MATFVWDNMGGWHGATGQIADEIEYARIKKAAEWNLAIRHENGVRELSAPFFMHPDGYVLEVSANSQVEARRLFAAAKPGRSFE